MTRIAPLALGPFLREDETGFDGLSETDFVGQERAFESGDWNAKSAASTWCGLRSTCASTKALVSFSILLDGQRLVSSWAKYFGYMG